jgi:hypothetical protein
LEAGRKAAEDAIAAAKAKADEDAERERDVEAGKFGKVRADLETKIAALTTERDDFQKRYEDAVKQIEPGVTAKWSTLPTEVTKLYRGADDDVIAKAAFVADTEDLVVGLTAHAGPGHRPPLTPRPAGPLSDAQRLEAEQVRLRSTGKYAI